MLLHLACAVFACCFLSWAQAPVEPHAGRSHAPGDLPAPLLRVDSATVVIPVHATSQVGSAVVDLKRGDFRVYDDGLEQSISYFATEDAPVSIGILVDASGSMKPKMHKAREAVARFMQLANRNDEFFLIEFSERPRLLLPFTGDTGDVERRAASIRPFGRTSLYDAVHMALGQMKTARYPRKALVVFSDGGDNRSRYSFPSIRNQLLESDVQLYAIGIYPSEDEEQARTREELDGPNVLEELTASTGGRHFAVNRIRDLPAVSERMSLELRSEYVLGYSPAKYERDGRFHRVRVSVSTSNTLLLQYRRGYYAPFE